MKSLGGMLKTAREERDLSIDQVAHETNISRHYLVALEEENFNIFPAETYLLGFLRNYADFLGFDSDRAVSLFRQYKLSEEPIPMEQLVGSPKSHTKKKVILWTVLILVLVLVGILAAPRLFRLVRGRLADLGDSRPAQNAEPRILEPSVPFWEGKVRENDVLLLDDGSDSLRLEAGVDDDALTLFGGTRGSWTLTLGEEIYLADLDGRPSWRLYLKDLPPGGGLLEVENLSESPTEPPLTEIPALLESGDTAEQVSQRREPQVILSGAEAAPFTLELAFRDFCLFRYASDGGDSRESYYAEGENFRLDVIRTVTLWASNAGAIYAKINGQEMILGRRGEVAVARLHWIRGEEAHDLVLTPIP